MKQIGEFYPSIATEPYGGTGEHQESWRDRKPTLVLVDALFELGAYKRAPRSYHELELASNPNPSVVAIQHQLFEGVAEAFSQEDCRVVKWAPGSGKVDTERHFIVLNTIDLKTLDRTQREALAMPVTDEDSFWLFADAFNEASPQNWPAVRAVGKEMKLPGKSNPPTFVNVLMRQIEPGEELLEGLEPKKIQAMSWLDMAHHGSWKVLEVFWSQVNGQPEVRNVILMTLEGGHPQFGNIEGVQVRGELAETAVEIGRRLKIFGSVESVPSSFGIDSREPIPPEVWDDMPAVKDLIATGNFLGEKGLISGAVQIGRLAKGQTLPRVLTHLAEYSQQAESARERWEPLIDADVITVTGTLGGSKTNMSSKDMVGTVLDEDGTMRLIRVGSAAPDRPSVEAREFLKPYHNLEKEHPELFFRVRLNDGGSYSADDNGEFRMRRITGIDHLHRNVKVDQLNRDKIIVIEPEDLDAVGCGVDANDEKSEYAIRQAYKQGQQFADEHNGRWPTAAVFYVPNHGWNAILFAVEDENGSIGPDLGQPFRDAIENGDLVYGTYAEDVTQV